MPSPAATKADTKTWPDLAIGLYDRLTGRDAEIAYSFDNFELHIPSSTAADAEHARWKMNGALRITTRSGVHARIRPLGFRSSDCKFVAAVAAVAAGLEPVKHG